MVTNTDFCVCDYCAKQRELFSTFCFFNTNFTRTESERMASLINCRGKDSNKEVMKGGKWCALNWCPRKVDQDLTMSFPKASDEAPVKTENTKVSFSTAQAYQLCDNRSLLCCMGSKQMTMQYERRMIGRHTSLSTNATPILKAQQYGASVSKADTGNKHQVANAGGNITQINYYGTDYAAAKTDASTQMDPSKFTKPLTDLALGTALKSPTVEECGYSDRLMQLTAGNSTITTQEAANAIVAYGVWPDYLDGVGEAVDKQTKPGPAVERFYTLDSVDWTTSFPGYYWRLPGCLTNLGMFGQNCAYHFLMKSGFCVHLQINASKFHQGMMMLVAIPEMEFWANAMQGSSDQGQLLEEWFLSYPIHQLPIFPHQFINLRTNNSATLILPYMNSAPAENALTHNYWTVLAIPIVSLQYQAGASTTVPITMSIAPMSSTFSGLRSSVPINQGGVPVHAVPGHGQFLTTLRQSGYPVYPEFEATHGHRIPGEVTNLMELAQIDTFAKPSPAETASWTFDVSVKTNYPLRTWDMDMNSTFFNASYLGRLCKWFVNYRGSIRLTFTFCGSAMATGKFLIAYTPPGGSQPGTRTEAMLATHIVWDIGLQSSCTFIVPWISQTQYRFPNTTENVYNYAGFISVFYQTSIVVPPGAPSTCAITVMVGACDDFQVRMPTDNGYFQGIEDQVGKLVNGAITHALESVDMEASKGSQLPDQLAVTTGDAAALTATETGASATTSPGSVMETRSLSTTFSARESDIENFFSKYALIHETSAYYSSNTRSIIRIPLEFSDALTQAAIVTKYRMFTYVRCAYDIVLMVSKVGGTPNGSTVRSGTPMNIRMQCIYCPPGTPNPANIDGARWYMPTTPSVYFNTDDPPASIRIPFVSVCEAYSSFYDGYSNFSNQDEATYGKPPGNYIGQLNIRPTYWPVNDTTSFDLRLHFMVFARPVGIRVWGPRPIVGINLSVRVASRTKNRIYIVDDDDETADTLMIGAGPGGSDVRIAKQQGPTDDEMDSSDEEMDTMEAYTFDHLSVDQKLWASQLPIFYGPSRGFEFHGIPIRHDRVLIPYHLWEEDLELISHSVNICSIGKIDMNRDYCELIFPSNTFTPVPLCDETSPCNVYIVNKCEMNCVLYSDDTWPQQEVLVSESDWLPEHTQYGLLRIPTHSGPGWCGSPVMCTSGVCGMVTAGVPGTTLATSFHCIDWLWSIEEEQPKVLPPPRKIKNAFKSARFAFIDGMWQEVYTSYGPVEQGPIDWMRGVVADFGSAFGTGAADSALEVVRDLIPNVSTESLSSDIVKTVLSWLVKIICAIVLISKAEDKASTAAAVGVILGVDLAISCPFEWLKNKTLELFHIREAEEQGPTEWVKDFNAFCTAARGLDWLGEKITKFVEWLRNLFKRESPRRQKFIQQLEMLPEMMEKIDMCIQNRSKYRDCDVMRLVKNMKTLKLGADVYGVERNFATTQIVKYHAKALQLEKTCGKARVEPVAILLHGKPGTGKSLATNMIGKCITTKMGVGNPYSLPPDPKHFDGYCQQEVVIMDDVAQNPDGEDLKLFCQMVSSTEFQVPMASLEEKGMAFTSKYVLCSTNVQGDLKPPTVAEPAALKRRFFLDLDIIIDPAYSVCGKLDARAALTPCTVGCKTKGKQNFRKCCPMVCGRAIRFQDRQNHNIYTLDEVVTLCVNEHDRRSSCGNLLEALFQGPKPRHCTFCRDPDSCICGALTPRRVMVPVDEWLESDFDKEACKLKTFEEIAAMNGKTLAPLPREVADLLKAIPDERIIKYCADQGWLLPPKIEYDRTRKAVISWIDAFKITALAGVSLVSLSGIIYCIYKCFAMFQGPYSGLPKVTPKRPEVRKAVVQGPEMEFNVKLMNSSLFNVETWKGPFTGLGLYDTWILLPTHSKPELKIKVEGIEFNVVDCVELENKLGPLELVAVKIDRPVKFRDIRKYFVDSFSPAHGCNLLVNNSKFPRMFCPVGSVVSYGRLLLSGKYVQNTCMYRYPTKSGQCGGIVTTKDNKIIALHIGGDGLNGYGAILRKKDFDALDKPTEVQGEIVKSGPSTEKPINVSSRTSLYPSVFYDVFEGKKEPAALHPKDKRLEVDLNQAMFGKYKKNEEVQMCEELELAVEHYVSQIKPLMPDNVTEPLPLEDVVYGIENLEGLDLNTSAGFPYVVLGQKKKDFIPERGESLSKLQQALDLHGFDQPYVTYLKDELRPIEKVRMGKTRLIECSSMNDTIRMKTALGRLFQVFHSNPGTATGSAVGCNPDVHWSKFYAEMGDNPLLAFDYSNYDASLHPVWFEGLKMVLKRLGFHVDGIINHVVNSRHLYRDIEYFVEGGMPSGCSGTSVFNSIINNLIIRTLVLRVYKGIDLDSLKIIAYGDDVIASYPFPLDAALLAEEGKVFGLTMTPADKSETFNEVTWETVTFLKRRFVPDKAFPFLVHPVFPMSEIHESLRWTRNALHTQEHVQSLCYLAWHTGKEEYEKLLDQIRSVPVGRALFLPSYEVLYRQWLELF